MVLHQLVASSCAFTPSIPTQEAWWNRHVVKVRTTCIWTERPFEALLISGIWLWGPFLKSNLMSGPMGQGTTLLEGLLPGFILEIWVRFWKDDGPGPDSSFSVKSICCTLLSFPISKGIGPGWIPVQLQLNSKNETPRQGWFRKTDFHQQEAGWVGLKESMKVRSVVLLVAKLL